MRNDRVNIDGLSSGRRIAGDTGQEATVVEKKKTAASGSLEIADAGEQQQLLKRLGTDVALIAPGQITPAIEVKKSRAPRIGFDHPIEGPFAPLDRAQWSKAVYALGAHYDGANATFAVPSPNAQAVVLEIYDRPIGGKAKHSYLMERRGEQFQAKLANIPEPVYYAYRFFGPNFRYDKDWKPGDSKGFREHVDQFGNRFNPNKVVPDPFGRELSHDKDTFRMREAGHDPGMYSSGPTDYRGKPAYMIDSGEWAPKSVLFRDNTSFGTKPHIAEHDQIIYEAHVRGLTQHASATSLKDLLEGMTAYEEVANIPPELRGTYKGAALMAKYLKAMGITSIELLPVHQFSDETGSNFWGYMTDGFFAPHRRYASDQSAGGPTREFKEMVKAFHDEGMEVLLDVVFNHTGEGGAANGTDTNTVQMTGLRAVDNQAFFALSHDKRHDWVSTGCGNNIDGSKPHAANLILESLKYWCDEMGVDGFRFDLASVLGREEGRGHEFNPDAKLLRDIGEFARSRNVKIIAEAWDASGSGYQVGNFRHGWAEWNGKYRDAIRKFLKSDGNIGTFMEAFAGSPGMYRSHGGPQKSINFVTAHDGFTLADVVSYNHKRNGDLPPPFGPSDGGADDNDSWDHRVGDNEATQMLRRRQLKNVWTMHMFARGVPMIVYGDEMGRTQNGNNNPYNVDTVATQNNYAMIGTNAPQRVATGAEGKYHDNLGVEQSDSDKSGLFLFNSYVTNLRRKHPCLRQGSYDKVPIEYLSPGGGHLTDGDRHALTVKIDGSFVDDNRFCLLINTYEGPIDFQVPEAAKGKKWIRLVDTSSWAETKKNYWPLTHAKKAGAIEGKYGVEDHALVVLMEVDEHEVAAAS